jgi:hypothetical protein
MAIIGTLPNNIQNGQSVDANPVMADFNFIVNQVNANASPLGTIPPGTLLNVRQITATGVYTPTLGTNSIVYDIVAGGGAGGGSQATAPTQNSLGTGGGGGARSIGRLTSGFSGVTITIGAGGTGVSGANGNAGGNSSIAALVTVNGGSGGGVIAATTASTAALGGVGGSGAGGIVNVTGLPGPTTLLITPANSANISGPGANSIYGQGGAASGPSGAGLNAGGFGAGGGGANSGGSAGPFAGGPGSPGVCILYEFS